MLKKILPSGATRLAGVVGASLFSLLPLVAASQTLSAVVSGEKATVIGPHTVLVSWMTDVPAGSQVLYGASSNEGSPSQNSSPLYGYSQMTPPISTLVTMHEVAVNVVGDAPMNYFRPVSTVDGLASLGSELTVSASALSGSCAYVKSYLKKDGQNDPQEVKNLQAFLRGVEKDETVNVTGVFDEATYDAVRRLQTKYADDVLAPWGVTEPTGYVYITTKKKINEIFCATTIALTHEEAAIIEASLRGEGSMTEIGMGAISNDGSLAWEDQDEGGEEETATTTGILARAGNGISSAAGAAQGKLAASLGGLREFLSKNQFLVIILFVLAFLVIYLYGNKTPLPAHGGERKQQKNKPTSIQEYKQDYKPTTNQVSSTRTEEFKEF